MGTKSPTTSVKSREMIGTDQFSRRRDVFDKHDTVFLPPPSPVYKEAEPIITSNHGITTSNFKRNTPGYSSMRETRSEGRAYEFRPRKYSDNFAADHNQSDDVDYRQSMIDRTRRLSKLRREFLNSTLHEPGASPLSRSGVRASLPTGVAATRYKFENLNVYKFPFAEPYSTPTPVRRVLVDLGSPEDGTDGKENGTNGKENEDPDKTRHRSLPAEPLGSPKVDHQKLFEELVKRYSPQRKPIDRTLPPTRPKIIGSVPKSTSSAADSHSSEPKIGEQSKSENDDVFEAKKSQEKLDSNDNKITENNKDIKPNVEILHNGSADNTEEENDQVPELSTIPRRLSSVSKKPLDQMIDLTIPDLIQKMTKEGEQVESHKDGKKIKRKRSFLDKLLGRNKGVKSDK
ncbi:uncharacterized protein LOC121735981 [Aricia agestis]|uniref:uncharacterized protein LOC121735981 n=1 Tax=Aricia agestis TaxID=91739 RepID=UPI001C201E55|nr:uncharacterized protein LOC121735981 [Aricia agestis]